MVKPTRKQNTLPFNRSHRRRSSRHSRQYHPFQVFGLTILVWLLAAWIWLPQNPYTTSISSIASLIHRQGLAGLEPVAQAVDTRLQSGTQIRLNGRLINGAWQRRAEQIGIADTLLAQGLGVDPLNTTVPEQQPVDWFSMPGQSSQVLQAWRSDNVRYLEITPLQTQFNWQVKILGNVLEVATPSSQISAIRQGQQSWGERIVIDLSQPATWQVDSTGDQVTVSVDAAISNPNSFTLKPSRWLKKFQSTSNGQRTVLTATTNQGTDVRAWSVANPYRLVLDFRQDPLQARDIQWAPGLRWQQQYLALGSSRFPVYSLTITPGANTVSPLPIWTNPSTGVGISPLISMAQQWNAAAAINGGFFNRNNQMPLGALRYNNRWISGPILNRGAIAWDNSGRLTMDRLSLSQVITTPNGTFPVLTVNSGYVQAGIGRYTADWGATYTPIVDNEVIVTVRNQQVVQQQRLAAAGSSSVPIPTDGYLLALRAFNTAATALPPGTQVILSSQTQPASFEAYPHVLGAGPLLIRQGQVVLNPVAEGFTQSFITGAAPRSAIGLLPNGQWLIATIQNRVGGRGSTLSETAQIMQRLGCVDALNLDGGSSASLYLNGQLLNRSPRTAARVHNGLGLFLEHGAHLTTLRERFG